MSGSANAALLTFDLVWESINGVESVGATGTITIDDSILPNAGFGDGAAALGIVAFEITVSPPVAAGIGTFTLADFSGGTEFTWNTDGAVLDLTTELVGQATDNGTWGGFGGFGDFNIFGTSAGAPVGTAPFQITTNLGLGEPLTLTSFAPSAASEEVPEPPLSR